VRDLTVGAAARLVRTAVSVSAALSLRNVVGVAVGAVVGGQRWSEILSQGVSPEISKITDTVEEGGREAPAEDYPHSTHCQTSEARFVSH